MAVTPNTSPVTAQISTPIVDTKGMLTASWSIFFGILNSLHGKLLLVSQTFATLPAPSAATEGSMAVVTDATSATLGSTVVGGGVIHILAYCDGTQWVVMGALGSGSSALPISGGGMTFEGTSPQVEGAGLGAAGNAPLTIHGSSTSDGNILLNGGAVSGNASAVRAQGGNKDSSSLIARESATGTATNGRGVFEVQSSNGTSRFLVLSHTDANPDAVFYTGLLTPLADNTLDFGTAATRIKDMYIGGRIKYSAVSTGANTIVLGTNSPATNGSGPFTWLTFEDGAGNTLRIPAWK